MSPATAARLLAASAILALAALPAHAQLSTAFTYQGQLNAGGQPASGLHDIRFKLFDMPSGGSQIGSTVCVNNVAVANGVFTTSVDFGPAFGTAGRFIEIEVRRDTGLDCANAAGFTVLAPRQPVTAAPLATHARRASGLDAPDGSPTDALVVNNSGFIGIGTTNPVGPLEVHSGNGSYVRIDSLHGDLHGNGGNDGYFGIYNDGPAAGRTDFVWNNVANMSIANSGGWVAIGAIPVVGAKLTVAGNAVVQGTLTTAPITRYKTIHGASFVPNIISRDSGGFCYADITGCSGYGFGNTFICPVELPDLAQVTELRVFAIDERSVDFTVTLGRTQLNNAGWAEMASVRTSGASTGVQTLADSSIVWDTILNNNYTYWLSADMNSFGNDLHRIVGVRITYVVTTPAP